MKEPIDWVRAVYTGAILGGFLWAIMVTFLSARAHGHSPEGYMYKFVSSVSGAVFILGGVWFLWTRRTFWRSTTLGVILAPLTGWTILLPITLVAVLPSHWAR